MIRYNQPAKKALYLNLLSAFYLQASAQRAVCQFARKSHAYLTPYQKETPVLEKEASSFIHLLCGLWKINLTKNPTRGTMYVFKDNYEISHWKSITYRSNWPVDGCGRLILAVIESLIPANPLLVKADYNPANSYKWTFLKPFAYNRKKFILKIIK